MPFQRDPRLVRSQDAAIKHSFVWPTWDFTHAVPALPHPPLLGPLTFISPRESIRLFGVPEVGALTSDNSSSEAAAGVIFAAHLPCDGDAVAVAVGPDGWLHAPCERRIWVVSVDGGGVIERGALQSLVPAAGSCGVKWVIIPHGQ